MDFGNASNQSAQEHRSNDPGEPIMNSITIENDGSIVGSCDTGRVQKLCGTSGQLPTNAVDDNRIELKAKKKSVEGRKQPDSIDQSKEDNSETRLFRCDICQKAFRDKSNFNRHIRLHTGEKPYECQVCKKTFTQLGALNTHAIIHTGEKPYQCRVCQKAFSRFDQLKRHNIIHTGDRPYQCHVCKKTFNQIGVLRRHGRIHTGEKPYECQVCEKTFTRIAHLKHHSSIHTAEKQNECHVCKKNIFTA